MFHVNRARVCIAVICIAFALEVQGSEAMGQTTKPAAKPIPARYAGFFAEIGLTDVQQQKFRVILDKYLADQDAGMAPDMVAIGELLRQVNLTDAQQEALKGVVQRWNAGRMKAAQRPQKPPATRPAQTSRPAKATSAPAGKPQPSVPQAETQPAKAPTSKPA